MKEIKNELPYYIGNDIVEEIIFENSRKFSNDKISFTCNDALSQLKLYKDDEFDCIICRHTLEHLKDSYIKDLLLEIKRVGKYAIITSSTTEINFDIKNFNGEKSRSRLL